MPFNKLTIFDPNHRPSILYVINHIDWFWSHRYALAKAAQDKGYKVYVAAHGAVKNNRLADEGFYPLELPEHKGGLSISSTLDVIRAIRTHIETVKPSLVHAITIKYAFMTGLGNLSQDEVPFVYTIAGLGYLFSGTSLKSRILRLGLGPFLKTVFRRPNAHLIFQNKDDMHIFKKAKYADPARASLISGSGVDVHKFVFTAEPENIDPVIFMPTRLIKEKGISVFVEAAKIVKANGYRAKFILGGGLDKNNPSALSAKDMEKILRGGEVIWRGKIMDMARMYKRSNMIVYPSYYREGVPKVLLEAAAAGRAIITTDHPGCRDVVKNGINGFLVPVKNAQKTADAIMHLLDNNDERALMGRHSREYAAKEFDVNLVNDKTIAVYELAGDFIYRDPSSTTSKDLVNQDMIHVSSS